MRALVRTILERPRYKNFRPESHDLAGLIGEKWRELMNWLLQLRDTDPKLYWALLLGLCALCALLIAHMVWTLRAALRALPTAPPAEAQTESSDFAQEARDLAKRGEHLQAAHQLWLASLRILAQRRHIPLSPEDGNRAVCRQLAASQLPRALREQLIELITETEQAWFGYPQAQAEGAPLYRRWDQAYAQLALLAAR